MSNWFKENAIFMAGVSSAFCILTASGSTFSVLCIATAICLLISVAKVDYMEMRDRIFCWYMLDKLEEIKNMVLDEVTKRDPGFGGKIRDIMEMDAEPEVKNKLLMELKND